MKALFVILSGGKGTRLRPATFFLQKTLFPVGRGKRIIDYSLESSKGTDDVEIETIVLARYKSSQVVHYIKSRYPNARVLIESISLDTGGALLQHWSMVRQYSPNVVIVLNGDHFVNLPLQDIFKSYHEGDEPALLLIGKNSDEQYHDYIDIQHESGSMLHKFTNRKSKVAYTGMFLVRFDALDEHMQQLPMCSCNMTRDVVQKIYAKHGCNYHLLDGEWDDLGTWKRYLEFLAR
jgi:NDP-sugar pyrophosphorylase family protein